MNLSILTHILCLNRVLDKIAQSSGIPTQSNADMQTTDPMHVNVSSQPAVPTSPRIPAQSSMFSQPTMPTQATMPTQSQQVGFSPFGATFSHLTG